MSGRNHPYSRQSNLIDNHRLIESQSSRPHVLEAQEREIQALLHDNQRLATTHVALQQELTATDQEIRHLSSTAANAKAETDALVREVYERSVKTKEELSLLDERIVELAKVKSDIQKMTADRDVFSSKLQEIDEELMLVRPELEQLPTIEAEIEIMQKEIKRGRAAIEYEKKMQAANNEQSEIMETHINEMAREIETLRAELANADKRARAAAAAAAAAAAVAPGPGYNAAAYPNPEAGYGGTLYPDRYPPIPIPQVHGGINGNPMYGVGGGVPNGPFDPARSNVYR